MHLFLIANIVTTSKALVTTSDAPVTSSVLINGFSSFEVLKSVLVVLLAGMHGQHK